MAIINHLIVNFNFQEIDKDFDFYVLSTKDNYVKHGAYVLDKPINNLKALGLAYENGKNIFIMFKKDTIKKSELSNAIEDEIISIEKINSLDIKDYILFRLFLYSLNNFESERMSFNNLAGKLYVYSPYWMRKDRKSFMALNIDLDQNMNIKGDATTFTNLSQFNDKIKKDYSFPRYTFSTNNSLKRVLHNDEAEVYIKKVKYNTKAEIEFLNLSIEKKTTTKIYFIYFVLDLIKEKYEKYLEFKFDDIKIIDSIGKIKDKKFIDKVYVNLSDDDIYATNYILQSEYNNELEILKTKLTEKHEIKSSDKIIDKALNITFIHNKDYYIENKYADPYKRFNRNNIIQCITYEDSVGKIINDNEAIINTIFKELNIKKDIVINKKITLDNWEEYNYKSDYIFGKEKDNILYFMRIKPDGSFEFYNRIDGFSKFNDKEIENCASILSDYKAKEKQIICDGNGNVILISRTNLYCLPSKEIYTLEKISRSGESREKLIKGVVDINLYDYNNSIYFSAGIIGNGMNTGIPRAALLYKIDVIKGNNIFNELLETLSVTFVKYKNFTVLPYPFKYLNEYIEMNQLNNDK